MTIDASSDVEMDGDNSKIAKQKRASFHFLTSEKNLKQIIHT